MIEFHKILAQTETLNSKDIVKSDLRVSVMKLLKLAYTPMKVFFGKY